MSIVINDKYIKVTKEQVHFPDGSTVEDYYLVEKKDYVAIVPLVAVGEENSVVLVEQFRPGIAKNIWNIPMGFMDPNETPEQTAQRELLEETGYQGTLISLGIIAPAPSFYRSVCHLFVATQCTLVQAEGRDSEINKVAVFSWNEALAHVRNSEHASDMTSLLGLLLAKENALR